MRNSRTFLDKKTGLILITVIGLSATSSVTLAENCPEAKEAFEKANKEGIGAYWENGEKLKWYLDQFSNNTKPTEALSTKFSFMQANYENQQLTCYYQWPNDDAKSMNWLSVRLKTTQKIKPNWNGAACSNFEAQNCQFLFEETMPAPVAVSAKPAAAITKETVAPATNPSAEPGLPLPK